MCNENALELVTAGYKSVNQHTSMSAEDCRTEVLALQRQSMMCVCMWVCVGVRGVVRWGKSIAKLKAEEACGCRA